MFPRIIAIASVLFVAASARVSADLVITWKGATAQGQARSEEGYTETLHLNRHKEDHGARGGRGTSAYSIIRDVGQGLEFLLWHGFKQYRETKLTTSAERAKGKAARPRPGPVQKVTPKNETRKIAGLTCQGFDVVAEAVEGHIQLKGTYWVAPQGQGVAEYQRFHQKLRDFTIRDGAAVKPGREGVQGVREARDAFMRSVIDAGFPCLVDYEIVGMNRRWHFTREAVKIATSRVPAEALAVPASYKRIRTATR